VYVVLSSDYRFGDGDLGPRGMALFFKTFRHNTVADSMGIPVFALSKNELKHQAKYEDDVYSLSSGNSSFKEAVKDLDIFAAMDLNRGRRKSVLMIPPLEILNLPEDMKDTERRSNQSKIREDIKKSLRKSLRTPPPKPVFSRTTSDVDEVKVCLDLAKQDFHFDHKAFRRKASGEMMAHVKKGDKRRSSLLIRRVSEPMAISPETRYNLGKVHYQLAVLHGMGRFPEVVQLRPDENPEDAPPHDAFSVLYHLAHAASMNCVAACLALGRLHAGLGTYVPIDFETAKDLLQRAMESPFPPAAPKAAAGCLLYHIYLDERESDDIEAEIASDTTIMHLLDDALKLIAESKTEEEELDCHKKRTAVTGAGFQVGDRVQGNYYLEGTFYPGVVESVSEDGTEFFVKYDDDGSTESLTKEHVMLSIPLTAAQTALGGPLSDEEALGTENSDEKCLVETYELRAELAELKERVGDKQSAAALYEEASNEAMAANKMKKATELSLKASELTE
jgi:elongation factor 2 kinase